MIKRNIYDYFIVMKNMGEFLIELDTVSYNVSYCILLSSYSHKYMKIKILKNSYLMTKMTPLQDTFGKNINHG